MPAMEYYCFFMELFFVGHAARQVEPNLHIIHKSTLLKPAYQVRQKLNGKFGNPYPSIVPNFFLNLSKTLTAIISKHEPCMNNTP